jgi:FAD/FMN-containing dehydrogenase
MANVISNYDGSITTTPRQLVTPRNVAQIQEILRDLANYPSPVRAKGSYHSLTPCVSSDGTIVDMSALAQVVKIDKVNNLFTGQAGMQIIEASMALRKQGLQLMTNIEIGNMTLGSAACCHSKDALGLSSASSVHMLPGSSGSRPRGNWRSHRPRFIRNYCPSCGVVMAWQALFTK